MRRLRLPFPKRPPSRTRARLLLLLGERRGLVSALALTSICAGFTEAVTLGLIAQVAAALVNGTKHMHLDAGPVHVVAGVGTLIVVAFGFTLLRLALQFPISILPARIASDVQSQLRQRLFHAFTRASWAVQSQDREGQLQETMTSQVMQATSGSLQATTLITALFTFLVLMIAALALNAEAAGIVLSVSLLLIALLRPLRAIGVRRARALSQAQMRYAGGISEAIRLAEETQVFGVAGAQRERIDGYVADSRRLFLLTQLLARLIPNLFQSLIYVLFVVGMFGIYLSGAGHAGALGAVFLLLVRAAQYGQQSQASYQGLSQSLPFIDRTEDTALRYIRSAPPAGRIKLEQVRTLAFDGVGYAYKPERATLSDISFQVDRGEAIGIVGPSGAGKSTLVQILLRLRTPGNGRYMVNDLSAGVARPRGLAATGRLCASGPAADPCVGRREHPLSSETSTTTRCERAARLARIHDDIVGWADGYNTIVGPRADAVSGGQQQRICLARALAARPEVLVLDEPTSALDPHSEMFIQESLRALKHELTLFIVAHRMSTLDMCDRVMVILDGRLAAFDTRAMLQAENAYYHSATMLAAGSGGGAGAATGGGAGVAAEAGAGVGAGAGEVRL